MCLLTLASLLASICWGWNGSAGIVVAIVWEITRGNKLGVLFYGFLMVIIGCVLLEGSLDYTKLLELIPGLFLGVVSSTLYTLS